MGFEAPENYSASFWCNKISVLLCEGPKPQPLFTYSNIPKYFKNTRKTETFLKYHVSKFENPKI